MAWLQQWKHGRLIAAMLLIAVGYAGAEVLLSSDLGWTVLWPMNGLTVALLLRQPRQRWPWLLLAIQVGTGAGELLTGSGLVLIVCQRLCSVMEVVLCALLLPAFTSAEVWLAQPRIVGRALLALFAGPAVSGVFAAVAYRWLRVFSLVDGWNDWATPDMLGIAVTLPVMLMVGTPEFRRLVHRNQMLRSATVLGLSLAVALLLFSFQTYPLLFLLYPTLLYVDWELGFAGASVAVATTSILGVFCSVHGLGPFGHWPAHLSLPRDTALQLYLAFHAVALLPLSLRMMERKNMAAQLQVANAQLNVLSRQDPLTGIFNRRAFDEALERAWEQASAKGTHLSVLMLDIDLFKQYNDCHGHLMGDDCLRTVATRLRVEVHLQDACVARFGGEEFVVLLPGADGQACHDMGERLRRAIVRASIAHNDSSWGIVTMSVGGATITPWHGATSRRLLAAADRALYEAKRHGRNRVMSPLTSADAWLQVAGDEARDPIVNTLAEAPVPPLARNPTGAPGSRQTNRAAARPAKLNWATMEG